MPESEEVEVAEGVKRYHDVFNQHGQYNQFNVQMGNLSANPQSMDLSCYQFCKSVSEHPVYGKASIYTLNTVQYAAKQQFHQSSHSLNRALSYLQLRATLSSPHLLTLRDHQAVTNNLNYLCGSFLSLHYLIEFVPQDLHTHLAQHHSFPNLFDSLKSLIHLLVHLKQASITLSFLTPYNLLYNDAIKIIDPILFDYDLQYPRKYHAPDQLQNDVWSLAITFLEMANRKPLDINQSNLAKHLQKVQSEPLKEVLTQMLLKDKRPDLMELQEFIKQMSIQEELIQPTLRFNSVRPSYQSIEHRDISSQRNSLKYHILDKRCSDHSLKFNVSKYLQENSQSSKKVTQHQSLRETSGVLQVSNRQEKTMVVNRMQERTQDKTLHKTKTKIQDKVKDKKQDKIQDQTLDKTQERTQEKTLERGEFSFQQLPSPYNLLQVQKESQQSKQKKKKERQKEKEQEPRPQSEQQQRCSEGRKSLLKTFENIKQNYFTQKNPTMQALTSIQEQSEKIQRQFQDLQVNLAQEKRKESFSQLFESSISFSQDTERRAYVCETYQDGSIYEGYKDNDARDGQGSFYYSDGGFYIGQWKRNQIHGEGTLYYPCGKLAYKGEWEQGKFQGYGIVYNQHPEKLEGIDFEDFDSVGTQWISYEGQFVADVKEGEGTLIMTNGDIYVGHFEDDLVHGEGSYKMTDGTTVDGIWRLNKLVQQNI